MEAESQGRTSRHDLIRQVSGRGVNWTVSAPVIDGWNIWDAWDQEVVDPYTLDIIAKYAKPGATIIDAGAYVGTMSLWAAHCGARVIAIEPDPLAQEFLHYNVLSNDMSVEVFDGAISSYTGTTYIAADVAGWGTSMSRISESVGREVACLTMQDLFDIYDVEECALVKLDVEGAECDILETAAPFLASHGVPLLVAMHQPWWTRNVRREWFSDFSYIVGEIGAWNDVLAIP